MHAVKVEALVKTANKAERPPADLITLLSCLRHEEITIEIITAELVFLLYKIVDLILKSVFDPKKIVLKIDYI